MKELGNSNFYDNGQLFLVRCPKCGRENYASSVATGCCSFCGLNGYKYYKYFDLRKKKKKDD
jgi:ribosomal protein L37E